MPVAACVDSAPAGTSVVVAFDPDLPLGEQATVTINIPPLAGGKLHSVRVRVMFPDVLIEVPVWIEPAPRALSSPVLVREMLTATSLTFTANIPPIEPLPPTLGFNMANFTNTPPDHVLARLTPFVNGSTGSGVLEALIPLANDVDLFPLGFALGGEHAASAWASDCEAGGGTRSLGIASSFMKNVKARATKSWGLFD